MITSEEIILNHYNKRLTELNEFSEKMRWLKLARYGKFSLDFFKKNQNNFLPYLDHINYNKELNFKVNYKINKINKVSKLEKPDECVVCFEETENITDCKHVVCEDCLQKWSEQSNSCPCCRESVVEDEIIITDIKNKRSEKFKRKCYLFLTIIVVIIIIIPIICILIL